MGLEVSHGCWYGGYSTFHEWRNDVAQIAGYELANLGGYPFPDIDCSEIQEKNVRGEWDETPPDPLLVIIVHADTEGAIHLAQIGPLADRLEMLLPAIKRAKNALPDTLEQTQRFVDGLRLAQSEGEKVYFT